MRLCQHIEAFEAKEKPDIEAQIRSLEVYGLRQVSNFDKYTTLSMAEGLVSEAQKHGHAKASLLMLEAQTLCTYIHKPRDLFQSYFVVLFSDKHYTKVLESISKVDKTHRARSTYTCAQTSTFGQPRYQGARSQRVVWYCCGTPGHIPPNCRHMPPQGHGRFAPYSKSARGLGQGHHYY